MYVLNCVILSYLFFTKSVVLSLWLKNIKLNYVLYHTVSIYNNNNILSVISKIMFGEDDVYVALVLIFMHISLYSGLEPDIFY